MTSHRRRVLVIALVAAVVTMVGLGAGIALLEREPGPASIDEAVADFAGGDGGRGSSTRPDEGVYVFTGSGSESLSILPGDRSQGPRMPATVTHRPNGCWNFRIDLHQDHWQEWHYCIDGRLLVERGGRTFQSWDLLATQLGTTSTFRCGDRSVIIRPGAEPGQTWDQACTGTSDSVDGTTVSAGPYRFVGRDDLRVGDETIPALHYRQHRVLSGAQQGDDRSDMWFRVSDGLPLRNRRTTTATSDSVVGAVTYSETGEWALTSSEPRT